MVIVKGMPFLKENTSHFASISLSYPLGKFWFYDSLSVYPNFMISRRRRFMIFFSSLEI